ncbi:TerB family tellurite resistance protein [bacterium]|nr:TerB family tellurite resistance protein [bacterium]
MRLPDISRKKVNIRVQYLSLIGHMARIDGKFDKKEVELLKQMTVQFKIAEKHKDKIFKKQDFSDQQVKKVFNELKKNHLHYSFMLDLIAMATADGVILEPERLMLTQISQLIGLKHEEFHKLINFAQATSSLSDHNHNDPMYQYVIEMFFRWARQKDVKLFKQTTFALNEKVDKALKKDL